jgi:hypothetical protein
MTRQRALASILRNWWPEFIVAAVCVFFILVGVAESGSQATAMFTFGGFIAVCVGIGWALGFRHRNLGLVRQVREIWETTRRIEDRGLGTAGPQSTHGPLARVLPFRRG